MANTWAEYGLPYLDSAKHAITSDRSRKYNCIAWTAGRDDRWWWPISPDQPFGSYYWPSEVPREVSIQAFLRAFEGLGYKECRNSEVEEGFEKIALFARDGLSGQPVPTHAARQLPNGHWTSKLGRREDIVHRNVHDVSGPAYGNPVKFMKRKITEC